ncbi:hypothetical protein [Demequina muriae]|uniref:DUF805 domain-containing protein n=1 Tax=Demequina muriae TaxID=3051664 RepID=A0ABT8GDV4_9MICO|nr:hypothetical protein [Demequina sp. EGI L300058]MDN4479612.1 hypothetical protein [Demequina sp. EGI L300058]
MAEDVTQPGAPEVTERPFFDWARFRSTLGIIGVFVALLSPVYVLIRVITLAQGDMDAASVVLARTDFARFAMASAAYVVPLGALLSALSIPLFFRNRLAALQWAAFGTMGLFAVVTFTTTEDGVTRWLVGAVWAFSALVMPMALWDISEAMKRENKTYFQLSRDTFFPSRSSRQRGRRGSALRRAFESLLMPVGVIAVLASLLFGLFQSAFSAQPTAWIGFDGESYPFATTWLQTGDGGTYYLRQDTPEEGSTIQWHRGDPLFIVYCDIRPLVEPDGAHCDTNGDGIPPEPSPSAGSSSPAP